MPSPSHIKEDVELMATNLRTKPTCIHPDVLKDPTLSRYRTSSEVHMRQQQIDEVKQNSILQGDLKNKIPPDTSLSGAQTITSMNSVDTIPSKSSESNHIRSLNYTTNQSPDSTNTQRTEAQIRKNDQDFIFSFDLNQYSTIRTANPTHLPTQVTPNGGVTNKEEWRKEDEEEHFKSVAELVSPHEDIGSSVTTMPTKMPTIDNFVISNLGKSKNNKKEEGRKYIKKDTKKYADDYFVDISDDEITPTLSTDGDTNYVMTTDTTSYPTPPSMLSNLNPENDPDYILAADSTLYPTPLP